MKSKRNPKIIGRGQEQKPHIIAFFWLFILFIGMTTGLAYLFLYCLSGWNFVNIEEIDIRGTLFIDEKELREHLEEFSGKNMFTFTDNEIEPIFAMFPRVKHAKIERRLPHTLIISIEERIPVAVVPASDGKTLCIDRDGIVIDTGSSSRDLPLFQLPGDISYLPGDRIESEALKFFFMVYDEITARNPDFPSKISEFLIEEGEIILTDKEQGTRLIIGSEEFKTSIDKLFFVYENFGFAHFSEIDLRFSDPYNELIILR
jgi:hypothetical protein